MADAATVRRRAKNPPVAESVDSQSPLCTEYQSPEKSHGYSWVFMVTVLFYSVISILCFIESRAVPSPKPHDTHYGEFSEDRARLHLNAITSFGPRPTGSVANEILTVNYLLQQIEKIKSTAKKSVVIEVDVQRPTGTFVLDFLDGFTSHYYNITNIVVRVSPVENFPPGHAVLINAHFDSVPNSPGASDDAVSCATMLEILRVMAECPKATLTHGVIFLFNGAEENVLQASHGFISQHKWASSVKAFVNLEAAGAGGKEIVFQTGPEHPWLVRAYTDVAPYPCAQVVGQEIFQGGLIPSDTDFRIFRDYGQIPGIDIAYHSNGYVYHTFYDTPAAITNGSVQRAGENVFAVVTEMANSPLLQDPGEYRHGAMVFFDFVGLFMVHYPARIGVIINSVTFVVASVFIVNRFLGLNRKKEANSEVVNKSTLKCLATSVGVLVLSWIAALVLPLVVAVLLTKSGHLLTWFCRPYLLVGLYVAPAVFGMGFVHSLAKNYNLKKKCKSTQQQAVLMALWKQETDMFYSTLSLWNALLGILTYYGLASAHLPLLMVAFPLVIRGVIWEKFIQKNSCVTKNIGQFMVCYLACVLVPLCLTTYMLITVIELFIPIMGRSGSDTIPDVFIAGLLAVLVMMQTSYLISITYMIRNVKWPVLVLIGLTVSSIAFSLSGLAFPYSKEYQCPKRFFYQHIIRTFHGADGSVIKEDSGIWINPLDYTGITHLNHVPLMKRAKPVATSNGVYEGYPYYLPARNLFKNSFYIDGPPPDVNSLHWKFQLLSQELKENIVHFEFSIEGPDHMTIYFAIQKGVHFLASSIGYLAPTHNPGHNGTTYFIYYSHGARTRPWIFTLDLQVGQNLPKDARTLEFAVAAHYLNGKQSRTPFLEELIEQTPNWVFAHSWVNIYESYTYSLL